MSRISCLEEVIGDFEESRFSTMDWAKIRLELNGKHILYTKLVNMLYNGINSHDTHNNSTHCPWTLTSAEEKKENNPDINERNVRVRDRRDTSPKKGRCAQAKMFTYWNQMRFRMEYNMLNIYYAFNHPTKGKFQYSPSTEA